MGLDPATNPLSKGWRKPDPWLRVGGFSTGPLHGSQAVCERAAVYRPRHPESTPFYQILDEHFERYVAVHEERFEPASGPLRAVVRKTVEAFLDCGRLHNGFARVRCPSCRGEHLLAFSCQTRNFCPSCQAKRSALFAEKLREEILAAVPHRHFVFTVPKALRGLFHRERKLLGLLARCAFETVKRSFQALLGRQDASPGMVVSIQTFGSYANFHPHLHAMVTDGLIAQGGELLPLPSLDTEVLAEVFRHMVLDALHSAGRLSERFRDSLLSWVHSGFSVYARQVIPPHDARQLERMARYITRPPIAMGAIHLDPVGRVLVSVPPDPRTGDTHKTMDPLDWIHAVTSQIPEPRQHLVLYFGAYANRIRSRYVPSDIERQESPPSLEHADDADDSYARSCRASWARLLRKILEVDPLLCPNCGVQMKIVSVITDPRTVDHILQHLKAGKGHDPFQPRAPPDDLADTA